MKYVVIVVLFLYMLYYISVVIFCQDYRTYSSHQDNLKSHLEVSRIYNCLSRVRLEAYERKESALIAGGQKAVVINKELGK
jgi:hypothetical protein